MEEDIEDEEEGANGNGGVGDIEGGPGIEDGKRNETQPDFEEIGDRAMDDAIGEIAGGAAQEQREADSVDGAGVAPGNQAIKAMMSSKPRITRMRVVMPSETEKKLKAIPGFLE